MQTESDVVDALDEQSDEALCSRICAGDRALFAELMRRNNQRLYRAIRSIVKDEAEVEELMQDAWVSAFQHLESFQGRSRFSTWLLRIGIHAALAHQRQRQRFSADLAEGIAPGASPERGAACRQLLARVEQAMDRLPSIYRVVLVLRQIEGLDTAETAAMLGIEPDAVKTRLHRARSLLRHALPGDLLAAFPFEAPRCDRIAREVFLRIG